MHLISLLGEATKLSSRTMQVDKLSRPNRQSCRMKNASHQLYSSFFKSHAEEQARYILSMPSSNEKKRFTTCTSGQVVSTRHSDRVVEWKMHLISLLGEATKLSSRTMQVHKLSRPGRQSCRMKNASHQLSALHTVYAFFYKQRSDISHAKEQARYTQCMLRSLSKDPSPAAPRNKRSTHCIFIAPAGISPRGEIPRRHPSNSRVY